MHTKNYIAGFIYLLNVNGADLSKHYLVHKYPASYLRWIQHIRHMPEMNWLSENLRKKENVSNHQNPRASLYPIQSPYAHSYNNVQTMNRIPQNSENYCSQQPRFPSNHGYFFYQKPIKFNIRQPIHQQQIEKPNYTEMSQQRMIIDQPIQRQSSFDFRQQIERKKPIYQYPLNAHQKMQPMMCVPMQYPRKIDTLETPETKNETNEELDDDSISEKNESDSYENTPLSDVNDEINRADNTNQPKIKHIEYLNSHQLENNNSEELPINRPRSEKIPLKENIKNHNFENKVEFHKKKKSRRRHRGPRINKKIGRTLLNGVHIAEDVAASGALGPQMKAAAIAAKAAETAIDGAIKGESAAEIMKKTAMTAASAAIGGSMKTQMMSELAAQSGLPVPPIATNSEPSTGNPLDMTGGGNLKQQMINQAGQQAINLTMKEVTKNLIGNQTGQTVVGP